MTDQKLPGAMQSVRHREITAKSNGITYGVWTWTPDGYEDSDQPYPLLILLDGEMMMGTAIETVALQAQLGESKPVIVAGISTAQAAMHGVQRTIDYSAEVPTSAMLAAPRGVDQSFWKIYETIASQLGIPFDDLFGGTDAFYSFMKDELLVELDGEFRIDPEEIGIAGHSSGGDFAVDTPTSSTARWRSGSAPFLRRRSRDTSTSSVATAAANARTPISGTTSSVGSSSSNGSRKRIRKTCAPRSVDSTSKPTAR